MMATAALFHLLNEQAYLELLIKTPALFVLRDQVAELRRQIAECRALLEAYRREVESW
jgi:hypothetical protein